MTDFPTSVDPHRFGEDKLQVVTIEQVVDESVRFKGLLSEPRIIYIIRGDMTELRQKERSVPPGTTEWEFSDGPINREGKDGRTHSTDYISLEEGLIDHLGCSFNTDEADFTPEEQALFDKWLENHNK